MCFITFSILDGMTGVCSVNEFLQILQKSNYQLELRDYDIAKLKLAFDLTFV